MEYLDFEEVKKLLQTNHDAITCMPKVALQKGLREIRLKNIVIKRNSLLYIS